MFPTTTVAWTFIVSRNRIVLARVFAISLGLSRAALGAYSHTLDRLPAGRSL